MAVLYTDIPVRWKNGENPDPPHAVEDGTYKFENRHGSAHVHRADKNNNGKFHVRVRVMSRDGRDLSPKRNWKDVKFTFWKVIKRTACSSCPPYPFVEKIGLGEDLGVTGVDWWPQGGSKSKQLTVDPAAFPDNCGHGSHEYEIWVYVMRDETKDTWDNLTPTEKKRTLVDPHVRFHDDDP